MTNLVKLRDYVKYVLKRIEEKMSKFISFIDNVVFKFWIVFTTVLITVSLFVKAMYCMDDSPYFESTMGIDIVCAVIAIGFYIWLFKNQDWIEKKIPYWLLVVIFATIGIGFVLLVPFYPISDPQKVVDGALMFAKGDIEGIMASDYLQYVVKNMKLSMFYAFFILPFPKTVISLRMVNVGFYIITALCTGKICKNVFENYQKTAFIFIASFAPLVLYTNQVYFDFPILCLGTMALCVYTRGRTTKNLIITLILLGIASFLRVLGGIFFVAVLMDFIFDKAKKSKKLDKKKLIIIGGILIVVMLLLIINSNIIINKFFRQEGSSTESIWSLFCMGINEPEFGMMHNELLHSEGYRTFDDFVNLLFGRSLNQNLSLFGKKIFWTWTQGTYQAQRYGFGYNMSDPSEKFMYQTLLTNHLMDTSFILPRIVITIMRSQYMALFVLMIVGIARIIKNKLYDIYRVFVYLFFGTFLILILYEMKSRYVLHLVSSMVVLAIVGLQGIDKLSLNGNVLKETVAEYRKTFKRIIAIIIIALLCVLSVSTVIWKINKDEADRAAAEQADRDARWQAASDICSSNGLTMTYKSITIEGLQENYRFLYMSDIHAVIPTMDELPAWNVTTESRLEMFKNQNGLVSSQQFEKWIDVANTLKVNGVLLGGDIIDYGSDENAQWLGTQLSKLEMPYVYALGNHDSFDIINDMQNPDNETIKALFVDGDDQCSYVDYGEFVVCAINDGLLRVPEIALEEFKEVYSLGKPIVLIAHAPLYTEQNETLKLDTEEIRGEDRLIGPGLDYELDEPTQEFYNMVMAEDSPVVAVLSGHIHFSHEDMLGDRIQQYVIGSGETGEAYYVEIKGN